RVVQPRNCRPARPERRRCQEPAAPRAPAHAQCPGPALRGGAGMMTCRELIELLLDFLSGELAPEELASFRQHLDKCPPCATYVETYQVVIHLTRRLPCTPLPPHVTQRLHAAVQQARRDEPPPGGYAQA